MIALDLFAGTGWGVACKEMGIEEYGVEIMPAAIETRLRSGMETPYSDVWDGIYNAELVPDYDLLIASPPCQTFSVAGGGAGRKSLAEIISTIHDGGYTEILRLKQLERSGDPRTALILTPLFYAARDQPEHIVFEQVPQCLPIWEACANVLRAEGYMVVTGILDAYDYGVPQSRKRAVLMASRTRVVQLPSKTSPTSWGEALGVEDAILVSNYSSGSGGYIKPGNKKPRGFRRSDQPSSTITSKAGSMTIVQSGVERNLSLAEAAILQSYPAGFEFSGTRADQFLQVGNAVPPKLGYAILAQFT